jgi:hypothetical protein
MTLATAVYALQVTLNLPDCPGGQPLAFNTQTNTLSCTANTGPTLPGSCSISSSPPGATQSGVGVSPGTSVTLTANCATGTTPITYTWNDPNFLVQATATFNAPAAQTTYSVTPSNSVGPGSPFSATVYIASAAGGTAPSNCSITQTPASPVNAGTSVNLALTCTGGSAVASCAWSSNVPSTSSCSVNVTAPSTSTTYSATPSNSFGPGPLTSTTVQIQATGGESQNFCVGGDQVIAVSWPVNGAGSTRQQTRGFGQGKVAFKITAPSGLGAALLLGAIRGAETPGAPTTFREVTVSKNSCDFQTGNYIYNGINSPDTSAGGNYTVNNPVGFRNAGALFNIQPGETLYFNIRNVVFGSPSCAGTCDLDFDFYIAR